MSGILSELFAALRPIEVVDVGANPIDGEPPYKALLEAGLCRVTGFEPLQKAMARLLARKGPHERYLPYAAGDGEGHTLNVCRASGMTSFLEPDPDATNIFTRITRATEVLHRAPVRTRRLDDLAEIERIDYLKLDIQGFELTALAGARRKLRSTVAVQVEVSFMPLYKEQPTFADVDGEMRRQGFLPHCFASVKRWPLAPSMFENSLEKPRNQLLEADMVYVRGLVNSGKMSFEQLGHLALIAHHCYGSYDLALRCIVLLERRKALPIGSTAKYVESQKEHRLTTLTTVVPN